MKTKEEFIALIENAVAKEAIRKLVFSKPSCSEIKKVSGRLVAHRGKRLLALEFSLPGDTVSHENLREGEMAERLAELVSEYGQVNLLTTLGDAEWKTSKKGGAIVLGGDQLMKKIALGESPAERALEELDRKKNYILRGDEDFLRKLGISSSDGRIHDKKQGKFRQINRFLENVEDIYRYLPSADELLVYDLCCGKSYLSFALYYYLTAVKGRRVRMVGIDLKRDVILWCERLAAELGYHGMRFEVGDISKACPETEPHLVISLHACDIATDIVIDTAIRLRARVLLSTPCCHRYINGRIVTPELKFVTDNPHIAGKLYEALTDPENTPKNTLIRAIRQKENKNEVAMAEYEAALKFLLGDGKDTYLKDL